LDVPDSVILMDKYMCRDATEKARSVSRQFSHGHVQYAGRGVVHRLPWEKKGSPMPRRPADSFSSQFQASKTRIALLEGHNALALLRADGGVMEEMDDEEEGSHYVDLSRCEQLMGKKAQLYGCGLCLVWVLEASRRFTELGIADLLKKLEETLDEFGFAALLSEEDSTSSSWNALVELIGCAYRPRRFEVGQALTRLRGIELEEILPFEDDGSEAAAAAEVERKKREMMEVWNARRKNKLHDSLEDS
jgi:hypothetical protein